MTKSTNIKKKAKYVRQKVKETQRSEHHCHWPGCLMPVPPALWGCKKHWFSLPKNLRDKIWATFQPGQEITKTPSQKYVEVAREVQEWIILNTPGMISLPKIKRKKI